MFATNNIYINDLDFHLDGYMKIFIGKYLHFFRMHIITQLPDLILVAMETDKLPRLQQS